jgi:hypothetical protein
MKRIIFVALLLALGLPLLPAAGHAEGGDGPATAATIGSNGDQGLVQPQASRWFRYDAAGGGMEQVEFTLNFWPSDAVRYSQVRLELYTAQSAAVSTDAGMRPLGEGFALARQEESLPVGRRVWMGWLVPGTYYVRVSNESPDQTFNYMVNLGLNSTSPAPSAVAATQPDSGGVAPQLQRPSLLQSGVLGLRGLRPAGPVNKTANSIDAILENKSNLYPAEAPMMYEIQQGRVRYGQMRWYKIEIGAKQERLDVAMHFWPSNGNIYHHVYFGIFTDYRLQVWKDGGAFQAVGVGGDTGVSDDRALTMNKKIWRGDLPHGVHYIGVWVDADLKNKDLGLPDTDFIDFLLVPTFVNQPNLPMPVTNIPDWLARPMVASTGVRSAVLASPRIINPIAPQASSTGPSATDLQSPLPVDAQGRTMLQSADRSSLVTNSNRWYRYDVANPNGENLNVTIQWNYSDGNTYHQAGFGVYDQYQFDGYLRDDKSLGIGIAGPTGVDTDFGPPMSRKMWRGVLPKGTYFIRVYNDSPSRMDYALQISK